jgi:hypothetical protein
MFSLTRNEAPYSSLNCLIGSKIFGDMFQGGRPSGNDGRIRDIFC